MIALLLNHLWQSSLFAGGAGLMALALRRNGATVRFWLWFAASIKFLIPFAALTALSAMVLTPVLPTLSAPSVARIEPLAKPFSVTTTVPLTIRLAAEPSLLPAPPVRAAEAVRSAPPAVQPARSAPSAFHFDLGSALLALWAAGFLMLVFRWIVRWSRVRALLRDAVAMPVQAPVAVKFSASRLEPGLVGIFNPVILLPQGIEQQLSPVELKAVLAHELCHWRRRDNLLAAIHMLVEALFWFFPLVWWLGARLNAERERACDESVLADGNDPQIYAEGILKVCRAYLQSPLACVAGVSGAGLKKRIDAIMENRLVLRLNAARKFVLSAAAAVALALPLALGLLAVPVVQLQAKAAQILSPIKTAQRESEQAPETARAVLPASPAPENPAMPQTQGAATTSADAAPPAAAPQSPPDAAAAPAAASTPNDTPQPQSKDAPAAMMARNDPPPALQAAAQTSVAQALAARNDVAVIPVTSAPDGRLQMQVTIQGHVINAELDTSSARTVMRRDIAERTIGLRPDTPDMTPVSGLEDGRHMQVYVHTFPQLAFAGGGVTAVNVPVLIQNYSMLPANDRHTALGTRGDFERIPDLVVGMDVLGQLHMDVALAEGRAYVTSARPAPDAAPATAIASAQQPRAPDAAQPVTGKLTTDQLRFQQTVEARTACTDQNAAPGSADYLGCVNGYLQAHYGWRLVTRFDGSLRAASVAYPGGNTAGSIGGHDFNPSPPGYVPNTGSSQPR